MALEILEFFRTSSSTKIGQSTRNASASASLGRESMLINSPSRSTQISAKNVSSRKSFTTIFCTCTSSPSSTFFKRSWVIGRGVDTFSISSAIALASYAPTQIGSTDCPCTSFNTTIGICVTGSIIRPRIFISSSIASPYPLPTACPVAQPFLAVLLGFSSLLRLCVLCVLSVSALSSLTLHWPPVAGHSLLPSLLPNYSASPKPPSPARSLPEVPAPVK